MSVPDHHSVAMTGPPGVLAIWNDREDAIAPVYEHWYVSEHVPERLAVPGFLTARRYERCGGDGPQFFTFYELASPDVLSSSAYLERLAAPSPLTRQVMAQFRNMVRTACIPVAGRGTAQGGCVVAAWVPQPALVDPDSLTLAGSWRQDDPRVLRLRAWRAAPDAGSISTESNLRPGGDGKSAAVLLADVMRVEVAENLMGELRQALAACLASADSLQPVHAAVYRLLGAWQGPATHHPNAS
jgi:hypothetical protein